MTSPAPVALLTYSVKPRGGVVHTLELAAGYPVMHAQDCISARAACRIRDLRPAGRPRDAGSGPFVIRTVHHVDDFTSPALIECQRQAIIEPDKVLVVSEYWRRLLQDQYGIAADVV